ncbi:hypothetical protein ACFQRK_23165 [Parapedobacter sp. GCM10030251]|uniref:hypothetical protein n=1 Tax=Parapedobacter sp. GCM10030251 TaxID=3273419 RepID=UPI00360D9987
MVKLSKQLPLVALLLAFTVFVGKAAVQALSTSSTTMWSYDPSKGPATEPGSYDPAPGATSGDCDRDEEVCLVEAPELNNQPDLEAVEDLIEAIQAGDDHPNLTYGAFSSN